jgi:prepilin-type N-terminal cleavage/methylation domain-containing protein
MFTNHSNPKLSVSIRERISQQHRSLAKVGLNTRLLIKPSLHGFTLLEIVIAMTILGMITGTLFALIQGSVRGAAEIEQIQRENSSIQRLLDLCRKTFTTLPSTATLELSLLNANAPGTSGQELTISGAPHSFGFGFNPLSYQDTILGLRPDPAGTTDQNGALLHYLCLSREDLIPETNENGLAMRQQTTGLSAPDEQGRYWMPLLPDVITLKWRFYKEADQTWLEEWESETWPDLIEIQLVMRDRTIPIRMVYSLPTLNLVAGRTLSPSNSKNESSETNNSNSTNNTNRSDNSTRANPSDTPRASNLQTQRQDTNNAAVMSSANATIIRSPR